jgi:hypothetical protein
MGDVDRKKHDVDVIERVLGGIGDDVRAHEQSTRLLDVDVPWFGGSMHSTVEMTVGLSSESRPSSESRSSESAPRSANDDDRRR